MKKSEAIELSNNYKAFIRAETTELMLLDLSEKAIEAECFMLAFRTPHYKRFRLLFNELSDMQIKLSIFEDLLEQSNLDLSTDSDSESDFCYSYTF